MLVVVVTLLVFFLISLFLRSRVSMCWPVKVFKDKSATFFGVLVPIY